MSNSNYTELSNSDDCDKYVKQFIQEFPLRSAEIGQGTLIKRALPSRHKRMIGAWCFLDHAGPVNFPQGEGLDVGPHPHIGLQTFTWMIEGSIMHTDSLGTKQLIRPKQVNLMTAGYGISHTEVAPDTEPHIPTAKECIPRTGYTTKKHLSFDGVEFTILVGEFLNTTSPVLVHSELLGVDIYSETSTTTRLPLNPKFEYGLMMLEGTATVHGHELNDENMLVLEPGLTEIQLDLHAGARLLLLGGLPFESPILLWWNLVGRTQEELSIAREQWVNHDPRFGTIPDYDGPRLEAPTFPAKMRASK